MKDLADINCLTIDYGKFTFVAEMMGQHVKRSYYHTPMEREFVDVNDCVKGDGLKTITRIDEFMDRNFLDDLDLAIFPDIGFGSLQRFFRDRGIAVWGAMGASDLELSRTKFLKVIKGLGLSMVHSEVIVGLTNLRLYLSDHPGVWVKINRYRAVAETWKHQDMEHGRYKLDSLAVRLGPMQDKVTFIVQDTIDSDVEIGYDGWCVGGKYPSKSFSGYELKNELYLGSVLDSSKLSEPVQIVNEAMAPLLREYGYQNFIATEIRVKGDEFYYIDPTHRMPGLTGDQLPETCENLPEVIWQGANGILIEPEFRCKFAAVATMHYKNHVPHEWFSLKIPDEVRQWFKLYHFCEADGMYHFAPSVPFECDEPGTVIGIGDTIEEAIEHVKENFESIDGEPVTVEMDGFGDLLKQIQEAEENGIEFTTQKIPDPASVVE